VTATTRLALDKPADDGSELVNVATDLNANYDKIDTAVGFQVVTSSTRPSTPYPGKPIAESNTGYRSYFHNGTSPASAGWVEIPNSSGGYSSSLTIAGDLTVGSTTWTAYTPTVANSGSATWTQRLGWYKKLGKIVFLEVYLQASGAGSGTTGLTISLPSTPFREGSGSANSSRQMLSAHASAVAAGTNSSVSGASCAVILQTGSTAIIDQLRGPTDIAMRGEQIGSATFITIQGWYREA
jgi:hypothetical protein